MKFLLVSLFILFVQTSFADSQEFFEIDSVDHSVPFTPEEEEEYFREIEKQLLFLEPFSQFPQTQWEECQDRVGGNYIGHNCTNKRKISVILKSFMQKHFYQCVENGLGSNNQVEDLHVVHVGIQGDPNHSPQSLHSEARAIDVHALRVKRKGKSWKTYTYSKKSNKSFYEAFRKCWGSAVHKYNGCPIFKGSLKRTGSIGREDKHHKNHMHVSVPYCVNGAYGPGYFRR